ncbi:hypothetical protein [Geobacter sp.]|uniref:hypothetical protein n=1 Tax=Geobacter sp. TaxID=46610 RepID=UPI001AC78C3D|nr:hypothetical protein [Geobacter sp.]CAG0996818.1 hypothetical protein ANAEL_02646 [Anaerolineales bacterium]
MELVQGTVKILQNTVSLSGGGKDSSVTTSHIYILEINGKTIKFDFYDPAIISDGDNIIVVGKQKNGVVEAAIYYNVTRNIRYYNYSKTILIVSLILLSIGLGIKITFDRDEGILFGGMFIALGLTFVYKYLTLREAITKLERYVSNSIF